MTKTLAVNARNAPTAFISVEKEPIAWRRFGNSTKAPPLLLMQRFRGTMDHWDPDLLDELAQSREVILFDSCGVGRSAGRAATSIAEQAKFAAALCETLGLSEVDLLGFSMGGATALTLALDRPDLVRRVIIAGSGPGGVTDAPKTAPKVFEVMLKPENVDEDFLFLFFHDSEASQTAGRAHLARLQSRAEPFSPPVSQEACKAQLGAIGAWAGGSGAALPRLGQLNKPMLVANGAHDLIVHAYSSYVISQKAPHAKLVLYPDAGHGFLFQYAHDFAQEVTRFLG